MPVKVREEQLAFTRRLDERTVDAAASGTLRLPGELPDVGQVIHWRPFAATERVQLSPDSGRVEAHGRVRLWVVYGARGSESADPAGAVFGGRLEGELRWTAWIEAPAATGETVWDARVQVRDVDGRFRADGRTADVDVVLSVTFSGVETTRTGVVTHVSATLPDRVEPVVTPLRLSVVEAAERTRVSVSESRALDLPAGPGSRFRVLDAWAWPSVAHVEVKPGSVQVRGELVYELLYAAQRPAPSGAAAGQDAHPADLPGEPGPAPAAEGEGPPALPARGWELSYCSWPSAEAFVVTLPIAAASPGAVARALAATSDLVVRAAASEGIVHVTAEVELAVQLHSVRSLQVVSELRAPESTPIEQRRVTLHLESHLGEGRRAFTAQATVEVPQGLPPVDRVVWCGARLESVNWRLEGNRLHASCALTPWMYYAPYRPDARTAGLVFASWPSAATVEQTVAMGELKPQATASVTVAIHGAEADLINRQTVEFTLTGALAAEARLAFEQEAVAEAVAVGPREEPPPFFYLVVTQPGDTLWKLARRYRTTEEAILEANPEVAGSGSASGVRPGQRLFIVRQG